MTYTPPLPPTLSEKGLRTALLFALVAERLNVFYEHDQWLKDGQGVSLARDWLGRSKRSIPGDQLKLISAASDEMARQIGESLSREAGLYTAHEMTEALDPNYQSELSHSLLDECARLIDGLDLAC